MTTKALAATAASAVLVTAGCAGGGETSASKSQDLPQPTHAELVAAGLGKLPVGARRDRVDVAAPSFSHPTKITNRLFPISELRSVLFSGRIDGKPFHTETTLLPRTQLIEWAKGQRVRVRVSQYAAYVDGRIDEVAIDYYAEADDGAVWYLGEDVQDYDRAGRVDSTVGTWRAGRDGPPAMIMPGHPNVGDVHRAENIPGVAFEEVAIKAVDKTVQGPRGPVKEALVGHELHDDGTYSDKIFAPGYGEFFTSDKGELEAMALAVPIDATPGSVPPQLAAVAEAADAGQRAVARGAWSRAKDARSAASRAWSAYRASGPSPRLASEMARALRGLQAGIGARDRQRAALAAIDVAQSSLDLQLRYRPPAKIDLARFALWARRASVAAQVGDLGGVRSDATTMEWIRDRLVGSVNRARLTAIDAHLVTLREAVSGGNRDMRAAAAESRRLAKPLALRPEKARD